MGNISGYYRSLPSSFWDNSEMQRALSPEARLLLACLKTCAEHGPAGIFRYYPLVLQARTGLTPERGWTRGQFGALFGELERAGWIAHDREREIVWVREDLRTDPQMSLGNQKHRTAIVRQLLGLPATHMLVEWSNAYPEVELPRDALEKVRETVQDSSTAHDRPLELFRERTGTADTVHSGNCANTGASKDKPYDDSLSRRPTVISIKSPNAVRERERERERNTVPAATTAPPRNERDRERAEQAEQLYRDLIATAAAVDNGSDVVCRVYLEEAERHLVAHHERRGRLWTPTRRRDWLLRLSKLPPLAVLAALEIYVDAHPGKDLDYLAGIARRLARDLEHEPEAFDRSITDHRQRHPDGVFRQAQEVLDGR